MYAAPLALFKHKANQKPVRCMRSLLSTRGTPFVSAVFWRVRQKLAQCVSPGCPVFPKLCLLPVISTGLDDSDPLGIIPAISQCRGTMYRARLLHVCPAVFCPRRNLRLASLDRRQGPVGLAGNLPNHPQIVFTVDFLFFIDGSGLGL